MNRKRTRNQLVVTPARMPNTRASWIDLPPPNMSGQSSHSALRAQRGASRRRGLAVAPARAHEEVDLLLLAHDHVLQAMLERLGVPRVAGVGDRVLQGLDRLRLG